jgi:hypothetical protein
MTVSTLRLTGWFTTNHRPKAKLPRSLCGWVSHPKYGLDWGESPSVDLGESVTGSLTVKRSRRVWEEGQGALICCG